MANFYYVKEGGSATGDAGRVATTRSTGSFATKGAANYYTSISAALAATTPPAAGDYIMCSDAHSHTYTVTTAHTLPADITIISVSDTNCDQYSAGAEEIVDNATTTLDYSIYPAGSGRTTIAGMTFQAEDNINVGVTTQAGHVTHLKDCTFNWQAGATNTGLFITGDGSTYIFEDCAINYTTTATEFLVGTNAHCVWHNMTSTGTAINTLFDPGGNGSIIVECYNCDLTKILAASGSLVTVNSANDDGFFGYFRNCLLPTGYTLTLSGVDNCLVTLEGCSTGSDYFAVERYEYLAGNKTTTNTASYLDATYDGTTGVGIQMDTGATTLPEFPHKYKLISLPNQDFSSGSINYEIEFTSATASLGDNDVWLEAHYQDNTNQSLGLVVSTQNTDILAAGGTAHTTTGTGTWAGGTGSLGNDYRETVTVTGPLANVSNATVEIYACVGKPSITVVFDPQPNIT